ncbi:MAG TPA: cupin domain-containing protein [Thermoanaerobaculia bacterium]|jgi:quercetin dioxygenase-like cupin family protein|nr:cupin domain-containing protein [Thermoanaerobaculia bacterium]
MQSRCHRIRVAFLAVSMTSIAASALTAQQQPAAAGESSASYARASHGTRWLEGPGVAIKVLVEASNFGGSEVEVAEIVLQPGGSAATHRHGSNELIYVLEGVLDHVVNGETHRLEPGMVGVVKLGDTVAHQVASTTPVKAVLVWAPGGEAERLAKLFKARPVDAPAAAAKP